tara:strand:+ start:2152 stop:2535 length:384 start_codon:yes stop_codon:yes gene_type:complete
MKSEKVNNRSFGILFFIVFLIIGLYPMYIGESPNKFFFILSLPFLILGLLNSKILTPFNRAWIKLGEILGLIIAPVIMALVYFVFLTPISLIVRIFGKDLLDIKFNKKLETYWINRKKNLGSMKKQF